MRYASSTPELLGRPEASEAALARIRARLRATSPEDKQLRTLLALGHELVRVRLERAAHAPHQEQLRDDLPSELVWGGDYEVLVDRVHEIVRANVPAGARLLVVSRGDDRLLVPGYRAMHFPQDQGGGYAGFYPANSDAVIEHLEKLAMGGAEFLIFPVTAAWWLDYYGGLARHLLTKARTIVHDEHCLLFRLRSRMFETGADA